MNLVDRNRRSEKLTKDEIKSLTKLIHTFPTKVDAAIYFGVSRQVLDMVIIRGSGNTDTVKVLREKLNLAQKAA